MTDISAGMKLAALCVFQCLLLTSPGWGAEQEPERFRTPSGNIHCMIFADEGKKDPGYTACDVNQDFTRKPIRPKPADCEFDWGQRFVLGNDSDAGLECASDWVGSEDSQILAYGTSIKKGAMTCSSEESGLTCKNANGHGFFLSRKVQKLF